MLLQWLTLYSIHDDEYLVKDSVPTCKWTGTLQFHLNNLVLLPQNICMIHELVTMIIIIIILLLSLLFWRLIVLQYSNLGFHCECKFDLWCFSHFNETDWLVFIRLQSLYKLLMWYDMFILQFLFHDEDLFF